MLNRWLLMLTSLLVSLTISAESLYVFVPTEIRANKLQQQIEAHCDGVEVTAFSRSIDFHNQFKSMPPSAILSLMPVIERTHLYNKLILGKRNGNVSENYVLVSIDNPILSANFGNVKIGVVDLLGRKSMGLFVDELLKTKVKLTRVSKLEDLLPLLSFGTVDAIFVSDALFFQLKAKSQLNLVSTPLGIQLGLAAAALSDSQPIGKLSACLLAFDKKLNTVLGVDQWHTL